MAKAIILATVITVVVSGATAIQAMTTAKKAASLRVERIEAAVAEATK